MDRISQLHSYFTRLHTFYVSYHIPCTNHRSSKIDNEMIIINESQRIQTRGVGGEVFVLEDLSVMG